MNPVLTKKIGMTEVLFEFQESLCVTKEAGELTACVPRPLRLLLALSNTPHSAVAKTVPQRLCLLPEHAALVSLHRKIRSFQIDLNHKNAP